MGKGGTKFCGDAVGVSLKAKRYSLKDAKKDMETYLQTGQHPGINRQLELQAHDAAPLPDPSASRPHVYLDLTVGAKPAGRIVVELFDDVAPVAAGAFRSRCQAGTSGAFQGTRIHRIVREQAAWGGVNTQQRQEVHYSGHKSLRHSQRGAVSLAKTGAGFLIAFSRALHLDASHVVVGRVTEASVAVLDKLNALQTMPDDSPVQRVTVARCGATDAKGGAVAAEPGDAVDETPEQATARIARETDEASTIIREAVAKEMERKRKEPVADSKPATRRRGMMDSLLDTPTDSSDGE